jgi:hypothetical protein
MISIFVAVAAIVIIPLLFGWLHDRGAQKRLAEQRKAQVAAYKRAGLRAPEWMRAE